MKQPSTITIAPPGAPTDRPATRHGRWERIRRGWPLVLPLAIFWLSVAFLLWQTTSPHGGTFIYALDDPYIHMAIAKNLVANGTWGTHPGQFASASSSLIWPLVIAAVYLVTGPQVLVPLLLNILFGSWLIVVTYRIFRAHAYSELVCVLLTTLLIFVMPLPALVMSGQEHILHTVLTLLLLQVATQYLTAAQSSRQRFGWMLILGPLVTAARYEGLFLVGLICLLLLVRRRFVQALCLGCVSMLPLLIFAAISIHLGWHALPSSVLLKGNLPQSPSLPRFVGDLALRYKTFLTETPTLIVLILAGVIALLRDRTTARLQPATKLAVVIYLAMVVLHLGSADVGWFFRYEAYLIVSGTVVIALAYGQLQPRSQATSAPGWQSTAVGVAAAVIFIVFAVRGGAAWLGTSKAVQNIYEQQIQMVRFVKTYYNGSAVAVNDIGALSFFTDATIIDTWGLANIDVTNARLDHTYGPNVMARVVGASQAPIAMIYSSWYYQFGGVPQDWIEVGRWRIDDKYVVGDATITIYATTPQDVTSLQTNLRAFGQCLPSGTRQTLFAPATSASPAQPCPAPAPTISHR